MSVQVNVPDSQAALRTYEIQYRASRSGGGGEVIVERSYEDFVALRRFLVSTYPGRFVPLLPPKHDSLMQMITGGGKALSFVEDRRHRLEHFLKVLLAHELLGKDEATECFLLAPELKEAQQGLLQPGIEVDDSCWEIDQSDSVTSSTSLGNHNPWFDSGGSAVSLVTSDQTVNDTRRELHQYHQQMGLTMQSANKYLMVSSTFAKALQDLGEAFMDLGQILSEDESGKSSGLIEFSRGMAEIARFTKQQSSRDLAVLLSGFDGLRREVGAGLAALSAYEWFRKRRDAAGRDVNKARADKKEPAELEARAAEEVWTKVAEDCCQAIIKDHASMIRNRQHLARSILLQYVLLQRRAYQHRCDRWSSILQDLTLQSATSGPGRINKYVSFSDIG